jgi:hypothetical protein
VLRDAQCCLPLIVSCCFDVSGAVEPGGKLSEDKSKD